MDMPARLKHVAQSFKPEDIQGAAKVAHEALRKVSREQDGPSWPAWEDSDVEYQKTQFTMVWLALADPAKVEEAFQERGGAYTAAWGIWWNAVVTYLVGVYPEILEALGLFSAGEGEV